MSCIIFTGDRNTGGKSDYTGAFKPEALALAKFERSNVRTHAIDLTQGDALKRRVIAAAFDEANGDGVQLERVVFLCHGFINGLQLGFRMPHARELAKLIGENAPDNVVVTLFACSTGGGKGADGDGGFADALRDELCKYGAINCRVDAHDRAGHCTRLPFVRRFEGAGSSYGGTGGNWIVAPGSELWKRWRSELQGKSDMRFAFSRMETHEVHTRLGALAR